MGGGRCLNYALLAVASEASKIAPFGVHLSLYFGRGRGSTYEASPLPPPSPLQLHCTLDVATLLC